MCYYNRVKTIFLFSCLFLAALTAFGQEKKSFSLGLLGEANANTRHGYGLAGGLQGEFSVTDNLAFGIKGDYGTDFYDVSSTEAMAYGRWYFRNMPFGFPLFVQAGGGLVVLFEEDRHVFSGIGDAAFGIRFPIKKFYTEQYVRGGWPHGFGFGFVVGYRFGVKTPPPEPPPPPAPIQEEEADEDTPEDLEVRFFGNSANFEVLGPRGVEMLTDNIIVLNTVATFMLENPQYRMIIVGHANPVEGTEQEEWTRLIPLSQRRADFVKNELLMLGVENSRILTYGAGGRDASGSPTSNRSVTFRFEKQR
jgi:outer membrane protein OmpA-like peptidoglycan-associated protein